MRLNRFDLNLLVALNALLEEGSVTRAARRLNLSQPAISSALKRLREAFNDDLLVANGKRMVPTPHALSLAPLVAEALVSMQSLLASSTLFDPANSQRIFRIAASDYVTTVVIIPLLRDLAVAAPSVRIELTPPSAATANGMERGAIDLIISPEQFQDRGHPHDLLFEERHVILGCRDNPIFAAPITEDIYSRVGHVVVEMSNTLVVRRGVCPHSWRSPAYRGCSLVIHKRALDVTRDPANRSGPRAPGKLVYRQASPCSGASAVRDPSDARDAAVPSHACT